MNALRRTGSGAYFNFCRRTQSRIVGKAPFFMGTSRPAVRLSNVGNHGEGRFAVVTKKLPPRYRHCECCGTEYRIKNSLSRYCSNACRQRDWSANHPGYMVDAQRKYLEDPTHQQRRDARMRQYRASDGAKNRARQLQRARYHRNPDPVKAYVRARRLRYVVGHTQGEWDALKSAYEHRCAYCGKKSARLTKDHIIPISQGDPQTVDRIENIVPACRSCNSRKCNRPAPLFQPVLLCAVSD